MNFIGPNGLPYVIPRTIVPTSWDLFVPYFNRIYEQMAQTINNKDNIYYQMVITSTPQNILNVPNFGAYIICVSGVTSSLPTLTASLCKADTNGAGVITVIGNQVGTLAWAGNALTITSTATNFQIAHNRAGISGNFNIRVIGTQGF